MRKMVLIFFFLLILIWEHDACAEYHPTPEMIPATTTSPINGYKYNHKDFYYPLGPPLCYSTSEAAALHNPPSVQVWLTTDPPTPCIKCPSGGYALTGESGSEICVQPCPSPYVYGTYFSSNGCFSCPTDYVFRDGDCQWYGVGPPPPRPAPLTPTGLSASDGEVKTISIKWNTVDNADYYELKRAVVQFNSSTEWIIIGSPADNSFIDGRQTNSTPAVPCVRYQYGVRACNYDFQCSNYSNIDQGYIALDKPKFFGIKRIDNKTSPNAGYTGNLISCEQVDRANSYQVSIAKKSGYFSKLTNDNFMFFEEARLSLVGERHVITLTPLDRTVVIQACCSYRTNCGEATLYNPYVPSLEGVFRLLGKDKK